MRSPVAAWLALAASLAFASCSNSSPAPEVPGPVSVTVTITGAGADLRSIDVPLGARVLFVNKDSRSHNMTSDPHPEHDLCPALNQVGFLRPGQQRETGNLVEAETCGFHDHDDPDTVNLRGQITAH